MKAFEQSSSSVNVYYAVQGVSNISESVNESVTTQI